MKVPAGTGLLLQGTDAETIPVLTTDDTDDVSENLLCAGDGSVISKEDGYNKYVLALDDDNTNVSFYLINGTSATVAKGKAYLKTVSSNNARQLRFSFETPTDIKSIKQDKWAESDNQDLIIYNLAGQRIDKPTKGFYIKNGKNYIR